MGKDRTLCSKCKKYYTEHKICDWCLLDKYKLHDNTTYDSLDHLSIEELVPIKDVIKVLRKLDK